MATRIPCHGGPPVAAGAGRFLQRGHTGENDDLRVHGLAVGLPDALPDLQPVAFHLDDEDAVVRWAITTSIWRSREPRIPTSGMTYQPSGAVAAVSVRPRLHLIMELPRAIGF